MGGDVSARTTDQNVRSLLASGDANGAVTALLRIYGPEVLGFSRGVLNNAADADEVFGATSERIWRSISSFQWRCSLRTWIYAVARNEIARFLRGRRRRDAGRANPVELENLIASVRTETDSILKSEKRNRLLSLRDELPVDDRALLILRIDRALAWDEIALTSLPDPDASTPMAVARESARLRKRFQIVRKRLVTRAREEGLLP